MDIVIENIVTYFMVLVVLILILYIFEFLIKDKKNGLGTTKSFQFIVRKYNLDMNRMRVRTLSKLIIVVNSFILSVPIFLMLVLEVNYYLMMLILLIVFVVLLISLYNLLGYILVKKGWKN